MTPQILVVTIGSAAAACSMASFLPQLIKLLREKTAEAVSIRMYGLTVTAFVLWIVYGAMLSSWPLMVSNGVSLALSSAILLLKWRYRDREAAPATSAGR